MFAKLLLFIGSKSGYFAEHGTVERKPFVDAEGKPIKVQVTTSNGTVKTVDGKGHSVFDLPNKTPFVPNSLYYLFSIPLKELENNPNL